MRTALIDIGKVGKEVYGVFEKAGFKTVDDLLDSACGNRIQTAIDELKNEPNAPFEPDHERWRNLTTRCNDVIFRIENIQAKDNDPEYLVCPISFNLFKDPVIAPSGYTYEREKIEQWIQGHNTDPMTRIQLRKEQLIPNRKLQEAVDYYKKNYKLYTIYFL